ncbi:hypothetical protein M1P56_17910 [Streptomyces sp. HU2014]|uniref:hypothetical protein n=1 Tax=Streptomyces sp. HU2014 TaxID=2939414 RepID=UPI00200C72DB|nr:hypothetical protein [Streptomyces sp. HU2014]UQI45962.1 hypothetical protein M1P56_17190 [Streptomyces sp. HU2014]UQI46086.1 hypothetical protein M1P56_17910 [Streptomyces sp. HU2014]
MEPSHERTTQALQEALVEGLMRIIERPDDTEAAREADQTVRALDTHLTTGPPPT